MISTEDRAALSRVVAVINYKGGTGKTSISANVAGLLAASGRRVLLVDLDPQGNLSEDLGYHDSDYNDEGRALARALSYGGPYAPVSQVRPGLDVAIGGRLLESAEAALEAQAKEPDDTSREALAQVLIPLAANYDVVVLDCPPSIRVLQLVAIAAAQWVLIPSRTDSASSRAMRDVARRLDDVLDINPTLDLLGVVIFGVAANATRLEAEARAQMGDELNDPGRVFTSTIRYAEAIAVASRKRGLLIHELEAQLDAQPSYWKQRRAGTVTTGPHAKSAAGVAEDYQNLTNEIIDRIIAAEAGENAPADTTTDRADDAAAVPAQDGAHL